MMKHIAYLALGTNLGNRESNISKTYEKIESNVGKILRKSGYYYSSPWGFSSRNNFLNTVICCSTSLSPKHLLQVTQEIERIMGRAEKSKNGKYQDRIIDIDILLYDDIIMEEPELCIPHPRMKERPFVMRPLQEILEKDTSSTLK